jgi:hypothetical protein
VAGVRDVAEEGVPDHANHRLGAASRLNANLIPKIAPSRKSRAANRGAAVAASIAGAMTRRLDPSLILNPGIAHAKKAKKNQWIGMFACSPGGRPEHLR